MVHPVDLYINSASFNFFRIEYTHTYFSITELKKTYTVTQSEAFGQSFNSYIIMKCSLAAAYNLNKDKYLKNMNGLLPCSFHSQ